ncbi:potassium channel family protein [Candidatus Korarchaeum cryptofilum]|uniref:PhoU family protein n=1 Tax=Korarchaeum cryptofilum (strain OPF8) TaxID=374847 RepID=B1L3F3_KORCO|nr:TrkA C-terminal domain-containing protein [Candidatus Korarchaeum cryptofilum]ACB06982.1 PhoU family protein [Candidatus Korarchaeum cryptofilum OPF8]
MEIEIRSVKEILLEMKELSEFALSLAYASLMYNDEELANEVFSLEDELDTLTHELFKVAIMSGASRREAEALAGLLDIGRAVDEVSDAMADLARLVVKKFPIHPSISWMLYRADEVIGLVRVDEGSSLISMSGEMAKDPVNLSGCEILALKRGGRWIYNIPEELEIERGDILLVEGPMESVETLRALASGKREEYVPRAPLEEISDEIRRISEMLSSMRNLSELSLYLSYAAMFYNNVEIAVEVKRLEEELDELEDEFYEVLFSSMKSLRDPKELIPLIGVASSSERVGDAAYSIASLVERGITAHPVLEMVVEESEDTICRLILEEGSEVAGRRIGDIDLEERTGVWILAIKRGLRWIFDPKDSELLMEGDQLILIGKKRGIMDAVKILGGRIVE